MAQRLVDIYLPADHGELPDLDEENITIDCWRIEINDKEQLYRVLVATEQTDALLEWILQRIGDIDDYRVVISTVEATLPKAEKPSKDATLTKEQKRAAKEKAVKRISREELHQDLVKAISGMPVYMTLVALSTIVAAAGMLRDSVAIVIGAMVIAPIIGPNIALSFSTTVGDIDFFWQSLKVNILGLVIGLFLAAGTGLIFLVDPTTPQIADRLMVTWSDIILALAAGAAGSLAFTRGASTALIGVMVAVALLPPLVAVGLMLGIGAWYASYSASLLLLTNIACINLAAVITFLVQGIRPRDWAEVKKARKNTRTAIIMWLLVLGLLMLAMYLASEPAILD